MKEKAFKDLVFFDLEVDKSSKRIGDIGALWQDRYFHKNSLPEFNKFIRQARILCGHNIIDHDLHFLEKYSERGVLNGKLFIDTLCLSALLFAEKPYHKLVKDYKLFSLDAELNNPVADSRLCRQLLRDEIAQFNGLDDDLKKIYYLLLHDEKPFAGFFELLNYRVPEQPLNPLIHSRFEGMICRNAAVEAFIGRENILLAFALALTATSKPDSILPPWMVKSHPGIYNVVNRLRLFRCNDPDCSYCKRHLDIHNALDRFFGFKSFKKFSENEKIPIQQEVVRAAMNNESLIAVFPTGGGKSAAFQLPALISGEVSRALTVIISPLQSLMKDQVDNLQKRHGITQAVTINGLLSPLERQEAIERVEDGRASILYISPESLRSRTTYRLLLDRTIARFVIDEAHCFSSWGHDFRVDYLYIGRFIKELQDAKRLEESIPVSCFTATAKVKVIRDIENYFREKLGLTIKNHIAGANRENLHYSVIVADSDDKKYEKLTDLLSQTDAPKIVYCARTKRVDDLTEKLNSDAFNALPYHGKMEREVRIANQNLFMSGEVNIIVATSAFGMGVDKDNVDIVVHYELSDSLENYVQEAGRAGRRQDIDAHCYILFDKNDLNKHFALYYNSRINLKEISQVWRGIKNISKFRRRISRSALEIARASGWDAEIYDLETKIRTSIAVLEEAGYVKRGLDAPRIFANSFTVRNYKQAADIINTADDLSGDDKTDATRILQRIIKEDETRTDYLADVLGLRRDRCEQLLRMMRQKGILGDTKDLSAFVDFSGSSSNTRNRAAEYYEIEKALITTLKCQQKELYLREMNEKFIEEMGIPSSTDRILNILIFWEINNFITKHRSNRAHGHYRIHYKLDYEEFREKMDRRQILSTKIIEYLSELASKNQHQNPPGRNEKPLEFSVVELKKNVEGKPDMFGTSYRLTEYEKALLFLNHIESVKLDRGFVIFYRPMTIERIEMDNRIRFKKEDYEKLAAFYQAKVEQIHVMGEYATKMLKDYKDAIRFTDDYFRIDYERFVHKYFKGREIEIRRPMTAGMFEKVFGKLSPGQLKIVKDSESRFILVTAGPGSGKTMVLVHKIASVLMMEDVKPEQFLMLTFSRATSLEFRSRLKALIGNAASYIDIYTYHSYCFELLGRVGDLEKSRDIITQALKEIESGNVPVERMAGKSMLVIDEFQDVNEEEYRLIRTIIDHAENIRVVAVGDDDQNIYGFRGASVEYMRDFRRRFKARHYNLIRNFRARKNLVEFTNRFVKTIRDRMKTEDLVSKYTENGSIRIIKHRSEDLTEPLIDNIKNDDRDGARAVLTHTNEEAVIVHTCLRSNNVRSKLILSNDSFRIRDLAEIRAFTGMALEHAAENFGLITDDEWSAARERLKEDFSHSKTLGLALDVIQTFGKSYRKKLRSEWLGFTYEMQAEHFIYPDAGTVSVSTMHKAKGREFDAVYLLLNDMNYDTDEKRRLLYVAMTRAKSSLVIHTTSSIFQTAGIDSLTCHEDHSEYGLPGEIALALTHRDIQLGLYALDGIKRNVASFFPGDKLAIDREYTMLLSESGKCAVKFSGGFKEQLTAWLEKGYTFKEAEINYIVWWRDKEKDQEVKIVLPVVRMVRG